MIWFKRCLILLFIVLQPLRGVAEAQAAFCDFRNQSAPVEAVAQSHAHHHKHGAMEKNVGKSFAAQTQPDHSEHHQQHGKSCASCCQACGPALTADIFSDMIPSPAAPAVHTAERAPASPVENHIRPPIA